MDLRLKELIRREGWLVEGRKIIANGEEFPITHPVAIHLKIYRTATNPETKYMAMKAAHDYLWPNTVWHYWTERRFREHCEGHNYISWTGGASTGKSFDAAKVGLMFWLANPEKRGVIVASTTLLSLSSRVWGYLTKLLSTMQVKLPFEYLGGNSPKVLYPSAGKEQIRDTIHGIFAVAAKQGSDESAISSWIGRHPEDALMLILDEATDLNPAITKSFPNLDSSEKPFQAIAIGNSSSIHDLHGSMSTPKRGWTSIDPMKDIKWETKLKKGICLFFNAYESPAIFEADLKKKKELSKFLITEDQIAQKEKQLGKDSDSFWRFVIGYWKTGSSENVVISKEFIDEYNIFKKAEWLGYHELKICAGLDLAFSAGGDSTILRLAFLGQDVSGKIVLDFRGEDLLFRIPIMARSNVSADLQIADQVIDILKRYKCPLEYLCIDATGQGRAMGEVLRLRMGSVRPPIKVFSARGAGKVGDNIDMLITTPLDLWSNFRNFMQNGQIKGMDLTAATQLCHRLVIQNEKTGKRGLELKSEYKKRIGASMPSMAHSPDEADSASLCLQSAISVHGFYPGQVREILKTNKFEHEKYFQWKQEIRAIQEAHVVGQEDIPIATFSDSNLNPNNSKIF